MASRTHNSYGTISISEDVIASLAGHLAMECYGVVEQVPARLGEAMTDIFHRSAKSRGVRLYTKGDRIYIELFVVFKYGLPIQAVADSLKSSVKYGVEHFTGMIVANIDVHVVGVKL